MKNELVGDQFNSMVGNTITSNAESEFIERKSISLA